MVSITKAIHCRLLCYHLNQMCMNILSQINKDILMLCGEHRGEYKSWQLPGLNHQ